MSKEKHTLKQIIKGIYHKINNKRKKIKIYLHNHLSIKNKLRCPGNTFICGTSLLNKVKLNIKGKNNIIEIGDDCTINNSGITIIGNNNRIKIGNSTLIQEAGFICENDNNSIEIGNQTALCGRILLAAMEKTKITIGNNCLLSGDLHFRTGDSHSIVDSNGKRINPSKDIYIGNHVWIGTKVTCLKNTHIPSNCVIAATSTVCSKFEESGCIIGGIPAKVIKKNINWDEHRL